MEMLLEPPGQFPLHFLIKSLLKTTTVFVYKNCGLFGEVGATMQQHHDGDEWADKFLSKLVGGRDGKGHGCIRCK